MSVFSWSFFVKNPTGLLILIPALVSACLFCIFNKKILCLKFRWTLLWYPKLKVKVIPANFKIMRRIPNFFKSPHKMCTPRILRIFRQIFTCFKKCPEFYCFIAFLHRAFSWDSFVHYTVWYFILLWPKMFDLILGQKSADAVVSLLKRSRAASAELDS